MPDAPAAAPDFARSGGPSAHPLGEVLFARYAYAPHAKGYCGPSGVTGLERVAAGEATSLDVTAVARRFSGAWAYQRVLGDLAGVPPLHLDVVRAYWLGVFEGVCHGLDAGEPRAEFARRLLAYIGPQAGSYWKHLDEPLLAEARPTHEFHVLGVYPWSRLLSLGRPEPLEVLNNCLLRVGVVKSRSAAGVEARAVELAYSPAAGLSLHEVAPQVVAVPSHLDAGASHVVLHWGAVCDTVTAEVAAVMLGSLRAQVALTNLRLS